MVTVLNLLVASFIDGFSNLYEGPEDAQVEGEDAQDEDAQTEAKHPPGADEIFEVRDPLDTGFESKYPDSDDDSVGSVGLEYGDPEGERLEYSDPEGERLEYGDPEGERLEGGDPEGDRLESGDPEGGDPEGTDLKASGGGEEAACAAIGENADNNTTYLDSQ